jgi:hypothetical protein
MATSGDVFSLAPAPCGDVVLPRPDLPLGTERSALHLLVTHGFSLASGSGAGVASRAPVVACPLAVRLPGLQH